jgi:hypothetical protein
MKYLDVYHDREVSKTNQEIVGNKAAIYICASSNRLVEGGRAIEEDIEGIVATCRVYEVDIDDVNVIVETRYPTDLLDRPRIWKLIEKEIAGEIGVAFLCEVGLPISPLCAGMSKITLIDLKMKSVQEIKSLIKFELEDVNSSKTGFFESVTRALQFN